MPDYIIGIIYSLIAIIFLVNLGELVKKINDGSSKISKLSLLATSSLVASYLFLALYFFNHNNWILFGSQLYLLATLFYIRYMSGNKHENQS